MSRVRRTTATCLAALLLAGAAAGALDGRATATAADPPSGWSRATADDAPDARLLPRRARGAEALRLLGDDLGRAAARNDRSARSLERLLRRDRAVWLDRRGRIFYADPAASPSGPGPTSRTALDSAPAVAPFAETFRLHSKPWATRRIVLDFDGTPRIGRSWTEAGLPDRAYPGYDRNGDPAAFDEAERLDVQRVWASVAEDFATVDVDVTTEDPGEAALLRTTPDDAAYGARVVVTDDETAADTICGYCSGYAYLSWFDEVDPTSAVGAGQPAFVFSAGAEASAIAETASHETGHVLGLEHDGDATWGEYSQGFGAWSPVMGAGYTELTQFSAGDYPGATNQQQDYDVMAAHGARTSSDDHGDAAAAATPLTTGPDVSVAGVIGTRSDVDAFRLDRTCGGPLEVRATPTSPAPDLDVVMRVLRPDGSPLATASPPVVGAGTGTITGLDARVRLPSVAAGTYVVTVDGGGFDDGTTRFGDYGSRGRYVLTATGCGGPTAPAGPSRPTELVVADLSDLGAVDLSWQAPASDGGSPVTGYVVSRSGVADVALPATARRLRVTGLASRTAYTFTVRAVTAVGSAGSSITHTTATRQVAAPGGLQASASGLPAGWVRLRWTRPATYGATIDEYRYVVTPLGSPLDTSSWRYVDGGSLEGFGTGLRTGTTYVATLWAATTDGSLGRRATLQFAYPPPTPPRPPSAPGIRTASSGTSGGRVTATARWAAPASTGGRPVTGYRVTGLRLSASGAVLGRTTVTASATARTISVRLPRGRHRFTVSATNAVGTGPASARSNLVTAR